MKRNNCIRGIFIENGSGSISPNRSNNMLAINGVGRKTPQMRKLSLNRTLRMNRYAFAKCKWKPIETKLQHLLKTSKNHQTSQTTEKCPSGLKFPSKWTKNESNLPAIKHKVIPKLRIDISLSSWDEGPPFYSV